MNHYHILSWKYCDIILGRIAQSYFKPFLNHFCSLTGCVWTLNKKGCTSSETMISKFGKMDMNARTPVSQQNIAQSITVPPQTSLKQYKGTWCSCMIHQTWPRSTLQLWCLWKWKIAGTFSDRQIQHEHSVLSCVSVALHSKLRCTVCMGHCV